MKITMMILLTYRLNIVNMVFVFKEYRIPLIVTSKSLIYVNIVSYGDLIFDCLDLK